MFWRELSLVRAQHGEPRRSKLRCNQNDHFLSGHFSYASLLLLFRKKARSSRLFACKRANYAFVSLPPFCENVPSARLHLYCSTLPSIKDTRIRAFYAFLFLDIEELTRLLSTCRDSCVTQQFTEMLCLTLSSEAPHKKDIQLDVFFNFDKFLF